MKGAEKMKQRYTAPSFEVTEFETSDIITISSEPTTISGGPGPIELPDL